MLRMLGMLIPLSHLQARSDLLDEQYVMCAGQKPRISSWRSACSHGGHFSRMVSSCSGLPLAGLLESDGNFGNHFGASAEPEATSEKCSDILTPLTALGVPFEIDDHKGPLIENPIHSMEQVRSMSQCTCTHIQCIHNGS